MAIFAVDCIAFLLGAQVYTWADLYNIDEGSELSVQELMMMLGNRWVSYHEFKNKRAQQFTRAAGYVFNLAVILLFAGLWALLSPFGQLQLIPVVGMILQAVSLVLEYTVV